MLVATTGTKSVFRPACRVGVILENHRDINQCFHLSLERLVAPAQVRCINNVRLLGVDESGGCDTRTENLLADS